MVRKGYGIRLLESSTTIGIEERGDRTRRGRKGGRTGKGGRIVAVIMSQTSSNVLNEVGGHLVTQESKCQLKEPYYAY
ncbi:conserved hypothetical protein [Ricinus communis]|uniref:Uncharacterized protein n=1 Tax=Ricinus communis TaxID=3988 RepID=B9T6I3_RICCO|nr:conserved hypothetical protein [Ricinus communis]